MAGVMVVVGTQVDVRSVVTVAPYRPATGLELEQGCWYRRALPTLEMQERRPRRREPSDVPPPWYTR